MVSPLLGLAAPRLTEIAAGEPAGPVTVAPVSDELAPASLRPNGEPAASSLTDTLVPDAAGMTRRPRPFAPSSALRIEQAENLIELTLGGFLCRGLATAIDSINGLPRARLNVAANACDLLEHQLLQADRRPNIRDRVIKTAEGGQLCAQCNGDAALRPKARVGCRLLP